MIDDNDNNNNNFMLIRKCNLHKKEKVFNINNEKGERESERDGFHIPWAPFPLGARVTFFGFIE